MKGRMFRKSKTLRILHIVQCLDIGGLESLVIGLCCQLKKEGVDVSILCLNYVDEEYISKIKENKIDIYVRPDLCRLTIGSFQRGATFLRKNHFNIVHAHSGCHFNAAVFSMLSGRSKLVYTAHGMPIFTSFKDRLFDSLACFATSTVVSVSHEINRFLRNWFLLPRSRFETIINGIDTSSYRPIDDVRERQEILKKYQLPVDRILFGSVGRLEDVKNYSMVLRALKIVVDSGINDVVFVLAGEGEKKRQLVELSEALGLSNHVFFLGMQYRVFEILPSFRFFVLSSLTEGTSISLLEAQSCGVPAIVTDVGGNSEVVSHGINGFFVPGG